MSGPGGACAGSVGVAIPVSGLMSSSPASPGSHCGRERSLDGALTGGCAWYQGVDVEDVEVAASVHQHLGDALLVDNGVDDERVATRSGNM